MKCGDCIYWEKDICYRLGAKVSFANNICEHYIFINNTEKNEM